MNMKGKIAMEVPPDFDWKMYLELNEDITKYPHYKNQAGAISHWKLYGSKEGRPYKITQDGKEVSIPEPENFVEEKNIFLEDVNNSKKLLTIVIPNKKGQTPHLTINSLYKQTFTNFDIIVVNDNDCNANAARNRGLRHVETPYVLFSDNDIEWEPDAIENMMKCLYENEDISYSYGYWSCNNKKFGNREWDEDKLKKVNLISTMSVVRTKDHPGFDENIERLQDWDVWLTMLENNKKGKYIDKLMFTTPKRDGITNSSIPYDEAKNILFEKHKNLIYDEPVTYLYDIIIPSWNQSEYVINCLLSIKEHSENYRVIFVNNNSENEEMDKILPILNQIPHKLINLDENLGFVKAVNIGIKESSSPYIILLNNDTEAVDGWLDKLVEPLKDDINIGLSGPLTTTPDSWQGTYPKNKTGYVIRKKGMLAFFCTMFKSDVFKNVGLLDESFGVGFGDDDDFCKRCLDYGYDMALVQDLIIPHHHRTTFKTLYSTDAIKNMQTKALNFFKNKHKLQ